jgi:hypothetical protein
MIISVCYVRYSYFFSSAVSVFRIFAVAIYFSCILFKFISNRCERNVFDALVVDYRLEKVRFDWDSTRGVIVLIDVLALRPVNVCTSYIDRNQVVRFFDLGQVFVVND